jgi:hypothetical protein
LKHNVGEMLDTGSLGSFFFGLDIVLEVLVFQ